MNDMKKLKIRYFLIVLVKLFGFLFYMLFLLSGIYINSAVERSTTVMDIISSYYKWNMGIYFGLWFGLLVNIIIDIWIYICITKARKREKGLFVPYEYGVAILFNILCLCFIAFLTVECSKDCKREVMGYRTDCVSIENGSLEERTDSFELIQDGESLRSLSSLTHVTGFTSCKMTYSKRVLFLPDIFLERNNIEEGKEYKVYYTSWSGVIVRLEEVTDEE